MRRVREALENLHEWEAKSRVPPKQGMPDGYMPIVTDLKMALSRLPMEMKRAIYLSVCLGHPAHEVSKMVDQNVRHIQGLIRDGLDLIQKDLSGRLEAEHANCA